MSDGERVAIMVGDSCAAMPVLCAESRATVGVSGRGLVIVDALAEQWGCYRRAMGKMVWAILRVKRDNGQAERDVAGATGLPPDPSPAQPQ
jgi:hypothetical protein